MIGEAYKLWSAQIYTALCPPDQLTHTTWIEKSQGYIQSFLSLPLLIALGVALVPLELSRRSIVWLTREPLTGFTQIAENTALWSTVNVANTRFNQDVAFGVATSHYQYGGATVHPTSQWNAPIFPRNPEVTPPQTLAELTRGGIDLWANPNKVIETLKEMHLTSFRLSVPESLWPDAQGNSNEVEYARFREILALLKENNIRVVLTCHHFSHPQEIEASGSFFNEGNCDKFVVFCEKLYEEFGDLVDEWCTINEPAVFATSAFMRGVFPPCEFDFEKMGRMMIQMIKMHNRVYCSLKQKAQEAGKEVVIGFSHQQITFQPEHWWNPLTRALCAIMTHCMSSAYIEFYRSGTFQLQIPFFLNMKYEDPNFRDNNGVSRLYPASMLYPATSWIISN